MSIFESAIEIKLNWIDPSRRCSGIRRLSWEHDAGLHQGWDASSAQCTVTHTFTYSLTPWGRVSTVNPHADMFLEGGRKPEKPEEAHKDTETRKIPHRHSLEFGINLGHLDLPTTSNISFTETPCACNIWPWLFVLSILYKNFLFK